VRKILVLLAGVIAVASLLSGGGVATADGRTVLGCYDNAKPYTKYFDEAYAPSGFSSNWFTTTANCADINILTTAQRNVRVCFLPSQGGMTCQPNWTLTKPSAWTVVATGVKDGTRFGFQFSSAGANSGYYAA